MLYVVTGGAGFIARALFDRLEAEGHRLIVIEDFLTAHARLGALAECDALVDIAGLPCAFDMLDRHRGRIAGVYHLGAISSTTCQDWPLLQARNIDFTLELFDWCARESVPLLYASSAATYGDGSRGFADQLCAAELAMLQPLNLYAKSKHDTDVVLMRAHEDGGKTPPRWYGCKFFNVYGYGEAHKKAQASVVYQMVARARAGKPMRLFRDGSQQRDWIAVEDAIEAMLFLMGGDAESGIYNIGTGSALSFNEVATAVENAIPTASVEWIDMPGELAPRYQSFTCADIGKLRAAGFARDFTQIEYGVRRLI